MELRVFATVVWRVVGGVFLIYSVSTAIVQFGAVSGSFGQIMDDESLYTGVTLFAIFLWPMVSAIAGIIVIMSSRKLAGLVTGGLDSSDR